MKKRERDPAPALLSFFFFFFFLCGMKCGLGGGRAARLLLPVAPSSVVVVGAAAAVVKNESILRVFIRWRLISMHAVSKRSITVPSKGPSSYIMGF